MNSLHKHMIHLLACKDEMVERNFVPCLPKLQISCIFLSDITLKTPLEILHFTMISLKVKASRQTLHSDQFKCHSARQR